MNNSLYNPRDKWKQRDGPQVLWVSFETFFIQRLNFCDFAFIWESRSLPARLSTPVALLDINSFNIFRIGTEVTFSNLSFYHGS